MYLCGVQKRSADILARVPRRRHRRRLDAPREDSPLFFGGLEFKRFKAISQGLAPVGLSALERRSTDDNSFSPSPPPPPPVRPRADPLFTLSIVPLVTYRELSFKRTTPRKGGLFCSVFPLRVVPADAENFVQDEKSRRPTDTHPARSANSSRLDTCC